MKTALLLPLAFVLAACGNSSLPSTSTPPGNTTGALSLKMLSNRADLISGDDALVELLAPAGADLTALRFDVNGRDISPAFAKRENGRVMGLVTGLALGSNTLRVRSTNGSGVTITITNHPIGGPVFTGPQILPYICDTAGNGLGPAADTQCNAASTFALMYRSSLTGSFAAYDPASPPDDLANTTTDEGKTVPYIVRVETGVINRGIYKLAVLFNPDESPQPWASPAAWNHKVMWLFGGGTAPHYTQDPSPNPLDDTALSRGFMVATGGLHVHGNNSNDNVSAESVMMLKEQITEDYGEIRYVIGEGCSGGGLQQHLIASQYPGLLNGLIPTCSYPDVWTTATEVASCVLMNRYFNETAPQLWPTQGQQAVVMGHSTIAPCQAWEALFGARLDPRVAAGCNLPEEQVYNAETNPNGARCSISDHMISILGPRVSSVWGPVETQLGRGFANRPISSVGVQFGLLALQSNLILPEQFVDLNEKLGAIDIDGVVQTGRNAADPGSIPLAYRAALVSDARQLAKVPIIDLRGNDDVEIHTNDWSYVLRARLDRHNGGHGNQIIFTGAVPLVGDPAFSCAGGLSAGLGDQGVSTPSELCTHNPLELMDRWLAAIEADASSESLERKVLKHKPADAVDTCFIAGQAITDTAVCNAAYPYFSNPLVQAGGPFATDNIECQLKPLDKADYAGVQPALSEAQFARLQAAFPTGVCDWSKPSASDQPSVPWLTFKAGPGGLPLGTAPVAKALAR